MSKTKEQTYKEIEADRRRGKRRFQQRLAEEAEAALEVEEFLDQKEEEHDEDKPTIRPFS